MRHGESYNNIQAKISKDLYYKTRQQEPPMSDIGNEACVKMGKKMKELGIKFEKIICSGHKRAILSAKFVREGLGNEEMPIELRLKCHEYRGCWMGDKTYPGLTRDQVKELVPDINIPEG